MKITQNIIIVLLVLVIAINVSAQDEQFCLGADQVIDVDLWVAGDGCLPCCQTDEEHHYVAESGRYEVRGVVHRGNPDQCQTDEDFFLSVEGQEGPTKYDHSDPCLEKTEEMVLGDFYLRSGFNQFQLNTASRCPPDIHPNSVDITKICIYKKESVIKTSKPEDSVFWGRLKVLNEDGLRPGDDLIILAAFTNGNADLDQLRFSVLGLDFDGKRSVGPFDMDSGEKKNLRVIVPLPYDIEPGIHSLGFSLSNDEYRRMKFREFRVI